MSFFPLYVIPRRNDVPCQFVISLVQCTSLPLRHPVLVCHPMEVCLSLPVCLFFRYESCDGTSFRTSTSFLACVSPFLATSSRASTSFILYIFYRYAIPCWYVVTLWKHVIPFLYVSYSATAFCDGKSFRARTSCPMCHLFSLHHPVPVRRPVPGCPFCMSLPLWHPMAVRHSVPVHGPSNTYKITPCWVTLLQPVRRAAVFGHPSSLRPHCTYILYIIWMSRKEILQIDERWGLDTDSAWNTILYVTRTI
jgi:hypothetical protein